MNWIRVEDELPEFNIKVLCVCSDGITLGHLDGKEKWRKDLGDCLINVSHWSPIPDMPTDIGRNLYEDIECECEMCITHEPHFDNLALRVLNKISQHKLECRDQMTIPYRDYVHDKEQMEDYARKRLHHSLCGDNSKLYKYVTFDTVYRPDMQEIIIKADLEVYI